MFLFLVVVVVIKYSWKQIWCTVSLSPPYQSSLLYLDPFLYSLKQIWCTVSSVPVVATIPVILEIFWLPRSHWKSNYLLNMDTMERAENKQLFKLIFFLLFSFSLSSFPFVFVIYALLKLIWSAQRTKLIFVSWNKCAFS